MKMYCSELEEVENRRIISLDIDLIDIVGDETSLLPKYWALSMRKSNADKQRQYPKKKFNESVSSVRHWTLKEVVLDMETLRENNKFYFLTNGIVKKNQIRSSFGRLKRQRLICAA